MEDKELEQEELKVSDEDREKVEEFGRMIMDKIMQDRIEFEKEFFEERLRYIELGFKISNLRKEYYYKELIEFIKGTIKETMHFDKLKELYDEFGYEEINKILIAFEEKQAKM